MKSLIKQCRILISNLTFKVIIVYNGNLQITKGSTPSLKRLAKEILSIDIQSGEHSSVEDARAAMQLYCTVAKNWEAGLSDKRGHKRLSE